MTLNMADKISSREAVGVWRIKDQVWKIYSTPQQLQRILKDKAAADSVALPMRKVFVTQGSVQIPQGQGSGPPRPSAFALVSQYMDGTHFTLQHGMGTFTRIVGSIKDDETLKRIERGCHAASMIGLQDPQGFIAPAAYDPIRFIDVHTTANQQSAAANEMYQWVKNYRAGIRK